MIDTLLSFVFVGALWGCTNPLLKQGSGEAAYKRKDDSFGQYAYEFFCTLTNWKFIIPFALNQSGSVAFVYFLGSADISMAVPICNSFTFVFTALTSRLLGERPKNPLFTYCGMILVLIGVAICFHSKLPAAVGDAA
ncbi:Aste57867_9931 [Aphanomyces stellatus]|uniref:Aste57867_9931 protein n=1 Tax=Aphanomyces stellatus TaxID=120398 RepID=A0A485KPY7_9STRA|nr:hypothetical protein As57867_009892 [Aphanomyces stellatus]VFT86809.1 Aste57867_9931 [Aphanomyces stellatus]